MWNWAVVHQEFDLDCLGTQPLKSLKNYYLPLQKVE